MDVIQKTPSLAQVDDRPDGAKAPGSRHDGAASGPKPRGAGDATGHDGAASGPKPHGARGATGHDAGRKTWTLDEVKGLHDLPLFELVDKARAIHTTFHPANQVQLCSLLSVKTGGCPEDCSYCSQSSRYDTEVDAEKMLDVDAVLQAARKAREIGASRFCMGAAWREVKDGPLFDRVLEMIRGVKALGLEACCTLGMLTDDQARRLGEAGLDAYNHNLDTSRRYYRSIITTRTYDERIETLERIRRAGVSICSGGIIGMGESIADRCAMLVELSQFDPPPDSVPINCLVPAAGTPLESLPPVDPLEVVRLVATARIVFPKALVRLSAGRKELTREAQLLCMYAGANSIFYGDRLLTSPNPMPDDDEALLKAAGLTGMSCGPSEHGGVRSGEVWAEPCRHQD